MKPKKLLSLIAIATISGSLISNNTLAESGRGIQVNQLDIIGSEPVKSERTTVPGGLFGGKKGLIHPSVTVTGKYSDNVFKEETNKRSDSSIVISPVVWLALPERDQAVLSISSANTAPGGLDLFLERPEGFNRYQGYAFYGADIEKYIDFSERDNTKQAAEAFLQYNLRGGLSLNFYDKLINSEDPLRIGGATTIDKFMSNLAGVVIDYRVTEKVSIRGDYNNFYLDYDEDFNENKNRVDNMGALYGTYKYSDKTNVFMEYNFVDIGYDTETQLDNQQNSLYAGVKWQPTDATKLIAKLGGSHKEFDDPSVDSVTEPGMELQADHRFTQKTSLTLIAKQKLNETSIASATHQIKRDFSGNYRQLLTHKISADISMSYTESDFIGRGMNPDQKESIVSFMPGVRYQFTDWLNLLASYKYETRDSDIANSDYDENSFYISINGGL